MGRRRKCKVTTQKVKKEPVKIVVRRKPKAKAKAKKDSKFKKQKQEAINAYMRKYKENKLSNCLYPVDYRMLSNVSEKERILQAHHELKTGKVKSIAEASRKWCVHYDKLQRRASGKVAWDKGKGPRPILSDQEETYLVKWITKKCTKGTPVTPMQLRRKAMKLLTKDKKRSVDLPSRVGRLHRWHKSFLKRHPQILKLSKKDLTRKFSGVSLRLGKKYKRGRAYLIVTDLLSEDSIISDELLEAVDIAVSAEVEISDAQFQEESDNDEMTVVDNSQTRSRGRRGVREKERKYIKSESDSDDSDDSDSDNDDSDSSSSDGDDSSDDSDGSTKKDDTVPVPPPAKPDTKDYKDPKSEETDDDDEVVVCALCKSQYGTDEDVWVGCDVCQNWMHVRCLPVLVQKETQSPENFWCCPKCSDWVHLAQ